MQYVVCYDIADDGRRGRVVNALLNFGARIQESVFLANLDEELAGRMKAQVKRLIDEQWDKVHVFELCGRCAGQTEMFGNADVPVDRAYYVV